MYKNELNGLMQLHIRFSDGFSVGEGKCVTTYLFSKKVKKSGALIQLCIVAISA